MCQILASYQLSGIENSTNVAGRDYNGYHGDNELFDKL